MNRAQTRRNIYNIGLYIIYTWRNKKSDCNFFCGVWSTNTCSTKKKYFAFELKVGVKFKVVGFFFFFFNELFWNLRLYIIVSFFFKCVWIWLLFWLMNQNNNPSLEEIPMTVKCINERSTWLRLQGGIVGTYYVFFSGCCWSHYYNTYKFVIQCLLYLLL